MKDRAMLIEQLIEHEGLRLKPYTDSVGKCTIGVGRNLSDVGISQEEAMVLLDNDVDLAVADLATFPWFLKLDGVRQCVMVDMRFNLGPAKFRGFKRMIRLMEDGDYQGAAGAMRKSVWFWQVKTRGERLVRMMATGLTLLLLCVPLHAEEPTPFRWPAHQDIPQRISDGAVIANLSLDAWQSLYKTDARTRWGFGCRMGLTYGIKQAVELLVHRTRPDGSDQQSFFSGHTAFATTAAYSPLTSSLAVTVGWGRMAGGRHFASDVGVGVGVGLLARKVCQ